jgi:hypothetical protein
MEDRERIEKACQEHGLTIREWKTGDDGGDIAVLGRFEVIEDDEDAGLYSGDEGELSAEVVGAAQYGNQRVCFSFMAEGYDEGNEVRDLYVLDPVTD